MRFKVAVHDTATRKIACLTVDKKEMNQIGLFLHDYVGQYKSVDTK